MRPPRLRLALLDASHGSPHTSRNFRRELDAALVEFACTGGEFPDGFDFDGFVVTGSRASVYDRADWMLDLAEWAGEAVEEGLPALGVCWGHQFLADLLGGEVADMGEYEIGYREIQRTGDTELLSGVDERFVAFTTHSDEVTALPEGATVLAENDYSIHAFRKDRVFGVQFHPEYDTDTAAHVTEGKDEELTSDRVERVLAGITDENYRAACETKRLFANFTGYVRAVRDAETETDTDADGSGDEDVDRRASSA
jgi:GMP synthase (glutamine-hydrolysing)